MPHCSYPHDHFGVRPRLEPVPVRNQLLAKLPVVVDLAVVGHRDRPVLVRHRLGAGRGEVDDRQPSMPERRAVIVVVAHAIRSAVRLHLGHAHDDSRVVRGEAFVANQTGDGTHNVR